VKLGISAEADLRARHADTARQAVTERILALADEAGYRAALIDVTQGSGEASVITWPQFAHTIRAAAGGLSRRGLREHDTAGIFVADAASHVVAVHAVRAAGAIAAPLDAADMAARLKEHRARLLITSAGLADLAIEAAERSLVRQVFAFGEAEGTTPFGSLLHTARHGHVQPNGSADVSNGDGAGLSYGDGADGSYGDGAGLSGGVSHGGSTGRDRPGGQPDGGAAADGDVVARILDLASLEPDGPTSLLTSRDVVVTAPPCGDPDVYTSLLDLALAAGAVVVAVPLPQVAAAVAAYKGTAAIVPRRTGVPGLSAGRVFAAG
jgi:AMP-binding enzyme